MFKLGVTAPFPLIAGSGRLAQPKTLTVAGYGASGTSIAQGVFPLLSRSTASRSEYVAGNSTDTLAKLQAQKGNQVIDVAIVDDGRCTRRSSSASARRSGPLQERALSGCPVQGRQGGRGRQTGTGFMINTKTSG